MANNSGHNLGLSQYPHIKDSNLMTLYDTIVLMAENEIRFRKKTV